MASIFSRPLCTEILTLQLVSFADGGRCLSHRMGLALIGSMLFVQMYVHRISMGIAIVRMVNHTALSQYPYNDAALLHADSHNFSTGQLIDNTTMSVYPVHSGSNGTEFNVNGSMSTSSVELFPADGTHGRAPCVIAVMKDTPRSEVCQEGLILKITLFLSMIIFLSSFAGNLLSQGSVFLIAVYDIIRTDFRVSFMERI